jgi:DNA-binding NarL/FixJ family response regulator
MLLLDSNLPGEDGRTALTTLRHEFPDTAFIGLSGDSAAGKVQAAMAGGAPGFVAKPFAAENVCRSIGPALQLPVDQAPMAPAAGGRPIPPDGRHVAGARSRATRGYNSPA